MDIEQFRQFYFNGKPNVHCGLEFSIRPRGTHWVFDFYIRELQVGKRSQIKISMEPDINHGMPHIHLNSQHNQHFASLGLNGQFIHGQERLNSKTKTMILEWVNTHSITLRELWNYAKEGRPDYQRMVDIVNNTWEYDGVVFEGPRPSSKIIIDRIIIWYDGKISKSFDGTITNISSSGKMCVYCPMGEQYVVRHYRFISNYGNPQIGYCTRI